MTNFGWWSQLAAKHGLMLCCLCFDAVPVEDAYTDNQGHRWDMCWNCFEAERKTHERRDRGGRPASGGPGTTADSEPQGPAGSDPP